MKIVYCDNGAYRKELKELDKNGIIKLIQFKYENKNKNIKNIAHPANPTWEQDKASWKGDDYTWDDYGKTSIKREEIINLIGASNRWIKGSYSLIFLQRANEMSFISCASY